MKFNNFDEMRAMNNQTFNMQNQYVSYNNFNANQNVQPQMSQIQNQMPKIDPEDEDAIGEYLYAIVEKVHPEYDNNLSNNILVKLQK